MSNSRKDGTRDKKAGTMYSQISPAYRAVANEMALLHSSIERTPETKWRLPGTQAPAPRTNRDPRQK